LNLFFNSDHNSFLNFQIIYLMTMKLETVCVLVCLCLAVQGRPQSGVQTVGLANPFAQPTIIQKLDDDETTVHPEEEVGERQVTGGLDPVPAPVKAVEAKPEVVAKPDSSEENGSAEEAGRKRRQVRPVKPVPVPVRVPAPCKPMDRRTNSC
jgi:hypothetical protein